MNLAYIKSLRNYYRKSSDEGDTESTTPSKMESPKQESRTLATPVEQPKSNIPKQPKSSEVANNNTKTPKVNKISESSTPEQFTSAQEEVGQFSSNKPKPSKVKKVESPFGKRQKDDSKYTNAYVQKKEKIAAEQKPKGYGNEAIYGANYGEGYAIFNAEYSGKMPGHSKPDYNYALMSIAPILNYGEDRDVYQIKLGGRDYLSDVAEHSPGEIQRSVRMLVDHAARMNGKYIEVPTMDWELPKEEQHMVEELKSNGILTPHTFTYYDKEKELFKQNAFKIDTNKLTGELKEYFDYLVAHQYLSKLGYPKKLELGDKNHPFSPANMEYGYVVNDKKRINKLNAEFGEAIEEVQNVIDELVDEGYLVPEEREESWLDPAKKERRYKINLENRDLPNEGDVEDKISSLDDAWAIKDRIRDTLNNYEARGTKKRWPVLEKGFDHWFDVEMRQDSGNAGAYFNIDYLLKYAFEYYEKAKDSFTGGRWYKLEEFFDYCTDIILDSESHYVGTLKSNISLATADLFKYLSGLDNKEWKNGIRIGEQYVKIMINNEGSADYPWLLPYLRDSIPEMFTFLIKFSSPHLLNQTIDYFEDRGFIPFYEYERKLKNGGADGQERVFPKMLDKYLKKLDKEK